MESSAEEAYKQKCEQRKEEKEKKRKEKEAAAKQAEKDKLANNDKAKEMIKPAVVFG